MRGRPMIPAQAIAIIAAVLALYAALLVAEVRSR
jgi:hypothetical protein